VELKDFVADALFQILEGVRVAASRQEIVGSVSPGFREKGQDIDWEKHVKTVDFDVAVTITNKQGGDVEAGGKVLSILNLKAKGEISREHNLVNKIKFSVPVIYPTKVFEKNLSLTVAQPTDPTTPWPRFCVRAHQETPRPIPAPGRPRQQVKPRPGHVSTLATARGFGSDFAGLSKLALMRLARGSRARAETQYLGTALQNSPYGVGVPPKVSQIERQSATVELRTAG
jgi:hypothetical protein